MQKWLSYNYKKLEFDLTLYWSFEDTATSFTLTLYWSFEDTATSFKVDGHNNAFPDNFFNLLTKFSFDKVE